MDNFYRIYHNDIGISFQWEHTDTDLTQIIFRDTGFHLTVNEIEVFLEKLSDAKQQKQCATCSAGENCRSILLQTPSNKVSMAVSAIELKQIEDLIRGTLFQLRMNNYLEELCKN